MDKKVCLDTDACISIVSQKGSYRELLKAIADSSTFISTISIFELFLRKTNTGPIEEFVKDFSIITFDNAAARQASEIHKELKAKGKIIDMRDMLIASISIANECTLATLNKKHFENIKDLKLLEF